MIRHALFFFLVATAFFARSQQISLLTENHDCSLRGLSAVDDRVIWVSGSNGTIGLSIDSGASWKWMTVGHYEKTDFRDIEAFSDSEAVIMGVTQPSVILKTQDGGLSWRTVFKDSSRGMFLDAMDFNNDRGIVVGDPVDHKIFLATTRDRGENWERISPGVNQTPADGEAFFAASGANIKYSPDSKHYLFVSGGKQSALYIDSGQRFPLHIIQGGESTGANAIALDPADPARAIVTGGDFSRDTMAVDNCILLNLQDFSQQKPLTPPHGYRSCVAYMNENRLISCGLTGVDISKDKGMNWKWISQHSFHVCGKSKAGKRVFLAGANGTVGVLTE